MRSELRNRLATAVLSCGFLFPAIAGAVDVEIAPVFGFRLGGQFTDDTTGTDVDIEGAPSFGLAVDVEYAPDRMVEVFYSRQSTEIEDLSPTLDICRILPDRRCRRVLAGELHALCCRNARRNALQPDGNYDSETRFSLTFGGGVKWFLNDRWAVKAEGRAYLTIFDSEGDVFCVSSGGATCLFRVSGSVVWQLEANVGVAFRF
jgi:opacity protein-like surface antigen